MKFCVKMGPKAPNSVCVGPMTLDELRVTAGQKPFEVMRSKGNDALKSLIYAGIREWIENNKSKVKGTHAIAKIEKWEWFEVQRIVI